MPVVKPGVPGSLGAPEMPHSVSTDSIERRLLGLDALSNLTREFARHPDVTRLLEVVILTLSGQFAVSSAFGLLKTPLDKNQNTLLKATGVFQHHPLLELIRGALDQIELILESGEPRTIADLRSANVEKTFVDTLEIARVQVMLPFIHEGRLVGLLGLGPRVGKKSFAPSDLELLATLAGTLTPLLINSVLYADLAHLKSWYFDILNSVSHCVFVFDRNEQLKNVNEAGQNLLRDFTDGKVQASVHSSVHLSDLFRETHFPGWAGRLSSVARAGADGQQERLKVLLNGEERIYQVRWSSIHSDREQEPDTIITLDDVTAERKHEERLSQLQHLADQGLMTAAIAHELNNYLALVLAGAELTARALARDDQERALAALGKMTETVKGMTRYTAGLTDFSRMRSQKQSIQLNQVLRDVMSFVTAQKRFQGIRIDTVLDPALPVCVLDPDQLAQVVLNLLNNSADAIAEKGAHDGLIRIQTAREGDGILLEISDNGIGIPAAHLSLLFKERHSTKATGHGFGLVTCGRIVAEHGGRFEVTSTEGQGASMKIRFDLSPE